MLFLLVLFVGVLQGVMESKPAQALSHKLDAMAGTDTRQIEIAVAGDQLAMSQKSDKPLKDCTVAINGSFVYQVPTINPWGDSLPLREFALTSGERFDPHRYKVNVVRLDCEGISRTMRP
jgi:hypothetical protein